MADNAVDHAAVGRRVYVADTHALMAHWLGGNLGAGARQAFGLARRDDVTIWVPTIVLAELLYMWRGGRLTPAGYGRLLAGLTTAGWPVAAFDEDVFNLMDLHPAAETLEMHDLIIACTALRLGGAVISRDRALRAAGIVPVIW